MAGPTIGPAMPTDIWKDGSHDRDRSVGPCQLVMHLAEQSCRSPSATPWSSRLISSLFAPDNTSKANVGHFMCELATTQSTWQDWRGKMPVITDAAGSKP